MSKVTVGLLLMVVVLSGTFLATSLAGSFDSEVEGKVSELWQDLKENLSSLVNIVRSGSEGASRETEDRLPTQNPFSPTPSHDSRFEENKSSNQPGKSCFRYTVTHLDGSTSNLCYTKSDYDAMVSLGSQLASAQSFWHFHLEGVARYQEEYEKTGSNIYLDAKASSQAKAESERQKIDGIIGQMQEIETRGY